MKLPLKSIAAAGLVVVTALAAAPSHAMNKSDLVDAMAHHAGISKSDAAKALEGFVAATTEALKKGDKVTIIGFGSFSLSQRAARTGRDPKTGKVIKSRPISAVKFKPGRTLYEAVNK